MPRKRSLPGKYALTKMSVGDKVDVKKRYDLRERLHALFIKTVGRLHDEGLSYRSIAGIMERHEVKLDHTYLQKLIREKRGKEAPPEDISLLRLQALGVSQEEVVSELDPEQGKVLFQFMADQSDDYNTLTEALREGGPAKDMILAALKAARTILDSKK